MSFKPPQPLHAEWSAFLATTAHHDYEIVMCGRWHAVRFGPWNVGVFVTRREAEQWAGLIKRGIR